MARTRFNEENCAIARSLDILNDPWTLLIVRDAFLGIRRFADFERQLGISKNILTLRLRALVNESILERVDVGEHGERFEYRLTAKGEALLPVLTTLREWGDVWIFGEGNEPLIMNDRKTGRPLPRTEVRNDDGRVVSRRDLRAEPGPGPGADELTRRVFTRRS